MLELYLLVAVSALVGGMAATLSRARALGRKRRAREKAAKETARVTRDVPQSIRLVDTLRGGEVLVIARRRGRKNSWRDLVAMRRTTFTGARDDAGRLLCNTNGLAVFPVLARDVHHIHSLGNPS